jgi:hypothetical protein
MSQRLVGRFDEEGGASEEGVKDDDEITDDGCCGIVQA